MSDIDRDLYALLAQCSLVGLPLSNALFADGLASKYELLAKLRALLCSTSTQHGESPT